MKKSDNELRELLGKIVLLEKENVGYELALKLLQLKQELKKQINIQDEYLDNRLKIIGSGLGHQVDSSTLLGKEAIKIINEIDLERHKHENVIDFSLTDEEKNKLTEVCKAKGTMEFAYLLSTLIE